MEWIKIIDAESIPLGVTLWVYHGKAKRPFVGLALNPDVSTLAKSCTHYMLLHRPKPPKKED